VTEEDTKTVLTVSDAMAQIPASEFKDAANDLLTDLDISYTEESDEFKLTQKHLRWIVDTALNLLAPAMIVANPVEEDDE
jgi:hypothetical protein